MKHAKRSGQYTVVVREATLLVAAFDKEDAQQQAENYLADHFMEWQGVTVR